MDHLLFDSSLPIELGTTILVEAQVPTRRLEPLCLPHHRDRLFVLLGHQLKLSSVFTETPPCNRITAAPRAIPSVLLPLSSCSYAAK
jgi:hypothetical protein